MYYIHNLVLNSENCLSWRLVPSNRRFTKLTEIKMLVLASQIQIQVCVCIYDDAWFT